MSDPAVVLLSSFDLSPVCSAGNLVRRTYITPTRYQTHPILYQTPVDRQDQRQTLLP